jgi:hypothetical protein
MCVILGGIGSCWRRCARRGQLCLGKKLGPSDCRRATVSSERGSNLAGVLMLLFVEGRLRLARFGDRASMFETDEGRRNY